MHPAFARLAETLHPSFERLMDQAPRPSALRWSRQRVPGVYLYSEGARHLYVGRTNDFRGRYKRHCLPSASGNMASFAFKLAREQTGNLAATYRKEGGREALMRDPIFLDAFTSAKARIREMDYRHVEEGDPVRQCLLEVYCAVALSTPYNDFDNH